jgi:hypothetical protein
MKITGIVVAVMGAFLLWLPLFGQYSISSDRAECQSAIGQIAQSMNGLTQAECSVVQLGWAATIGMMILGVIVFTVGLARRDEDERY